ncbi:MAG: glycoside hydrolase [Planctomycetota bacterium]
MRVCLTITSCRILTGVFVMFFVHNFCRAQVVCLPGRGPDLNTRAENPLSVTIDLALQKQTIHGFGASDCWTVQFIGQWPLKKRMAIADLLFETGYGLAQGRYLFVRGFQAL